MSGRRERIPEAGPWLLVFGTHTVINPAHKNSNSYRLLTLFCLPDVYHLNPHIRWVLLLSPLHRRQNRGPEKRTDFPQDSHLETAELEPQAPSTWPHSPVLKGHVRPRERLVALATTSRQLPPQASSCDLWGGQRWPC